MSRAVYSRSFDGGWSPSLARINYTDTLLAEQTSEPVMGINLLGPPACAKNQTPTEDSGGWCCLGPWGFILGE